jgi:hypothetical protein
MSTVYHCPIEGYEFDYLDGRLWLGAPFDTSNPAMIELLNVALRVTAIFKVAEVIDQAGGVFEPALAQFVSDDEINQCLVTYAETLDWEIEWPLEISRFLSELRDESHRRFYHPPNAKSKNPEKGYVYLIRSVTGHYKIGYSRNPDDRLRTFSVKLPFEVEFEHLIPSDDMRADERMLHEKFEDKHVNGEWFDLAPEDVAYIKSLGGAS